MFPHRRIPKVEALVPLAVAVLMALPGCGGGGGTVTGTSSPAPTPTPAPVRSVIASGSTALTVEQFVAVPFTTLGAGALDATVDWTFASDLLLMYLAQGQCTVEQFAEDVCPDDPACACRFAVRAENPFQKPRILTLANAAAGPYTLIVWNLGPQDESISFQVGLTRSGSSSLDGPAGTSGARRGGSPATPALVRHLKRRAADEPLAPRPRGW